MKSFRFVKFTVVLALLLVASLLLTSCSLSKNTGETQWLVVATSQEIADAGLPDAISARFEQQYNVKIKWLPVSTCKALNYANQDSRIDVMLISGGNLLDQPAPPDYDFCKDAPLPTDSTAGILAGPAPTLPAYNAPATTPTPLVPSVAPLPSPTPLAIKYLWAERQRVFWSPLVLVGPTSDPLHLANSANIAKALKTLGEENGAFLSPGQEPGIRQLEEQWWQQVGTGELKLRGQNYRIYDGDAKTTLTAAENSNTYTIVPLDIYLTSQENSKLSIILGQDISMFMPYEAMVHNSTRCGNCNLQLAREFINYLLTPDIQKAITKLGQTQYKREFFRPADYRVYRPQ